MTIDMWLGEVVIHQTNLEYLISNWHPVISKQYGDMTITAPRAEAACKVVRDSIKKSNTKDPVLRFREALNKKDWREINNILNEAWFGVPESTDCWQIRGFKEAVNLIDTLPETDYDKYLKSQDDPRD